MTLAARLEAALAATASDAALLAGDDHPSRDAEALTYTDAAVLIPVTDRAEPGVILTRRTETLRRHAGQIAFPGGRLDAGEDAVTAALREAEEEIALPRQQVGVVGALDRYRTGTGFDVTPVVAVIPPDLPLHPSEAEVANVFEAPLAFLLDAANQREATAVLRGRERRFHEIVWGEWRIWGVTAAIIVNLARRLGRW